MRDLANGIAKDPESKSARKPNPLDAHVGGRVKLRRMLLGMSQEKLGEHLGLTFQQVQKYEKGVNRIGASRLFELSQVLGVPIQFFYDQLPERKSASAAAAPGFAESEGEGYVVDFLSTREGLELNKAFMSIRNPRIRRSIVELIRSLSDTDKDCA
ncbi:MAG: helix-turn-helix transcriptional regulator [Pseudomonadota bacterium]